MATYVYTNGIGAASGSAIATARRFISPGQVWYVDSVNGVDAGSSAGLDRIAPLKTLGQAVTNAAAGDTITLMPGFSETLMATVSLDDNMTLVGEGSGSNRPVITWAGATGPAIEVNGLNCMIDNIWFADSTTSPDSGGRVAVASDAFIISNCVFESGDSDDYPALMIDGSSAGFAIVENCTFTNVATTTQPAAALQAKSVMVNLYVKDCTFDGGTIGWSGRVALNVPVSLQAVRLQGITLLNDSDVSVTTGVKGFITDQNPSGSTRVVWG